MTLGAGKTTLLYALAQKLRQGATTGIIQLNGADLPAEFKRETGFVDQFDIHDETATVREAVMFSAALRHPSTGAGYDDAQEAIRLLEISEIENAVIGSLGLEEKKVSHTFPDLLS